MLHNMRQVPRDLPVFERGMQMTERDKDWELLGEYYDNSKEEKKLSLENFMEEDSPLDEGISSNSDLQFQKTVEDVHQVLSLAGEGKSISEIASMTGLEQQYVYDIQVCAQGFREDDEIAVAHLVLG